MAYSQEIKNKAKSLATKGIPLSEISKDMGISERTLYNWCKNISADAIEEQIQTLSKRKPTEANTRKIAMLVNSLGKIKNMRKKKKPRPSVIFNAEVYKIKERMLTDEYGLYGYQKRFIQDESRFRIWLKSRQIGATYGCAGECLADAMGGLDQLILSASEEQALKWTNEINIHATKLGITLGGSQNKILTPAGTTIHIFANNFRTIQGFSGSIWLDEFAWYTNPKRIWETFGPSITSVKAGETKARATILSTPFEQNSLFEKILKDEQKYYMFSRHITTIHDAIADGLDVDVTILKDLFDNDSWMMMYECQFVDDESALLNVSLIKSCVDSNLKIEATAQEALRAGYDIGRKIDLSVLIAFSLRNGLFVMSHYDTFKKASFDAQRNALDDFLGTHQNAMLKIDATGIGADLAEGMHKKYKKRAIEVFFTAQSKERMALNLKKAMEDGRLRIPNDPLLIADLHAIKRKAGARGFLYDANRDEHGHADRFWATALALFHEDFIGNKKGFDYKEAALVLANIDHKNTFLAQFKKGTK